MSDKPEIELDLDLQLLPAWARQPQTANRYAEYEQVGDRERRGPRDRGGPRREGPRDRRFEGRGPRPGGGGPPRGQRGDDPRGPRGRGARGPEGPRREPVEELPEGIEVDLIPEPSGVDSLTKQIRQTGRAYPLFDIGHLILKRPDRYQLEFRAIGNLPDGSPRQLYVCSLDDTVWMTEEEAVRNVLTKHFDTFYSTEKIPVDPPKGTYTFVAQCGMSGIILGPPNLHDYQTKLQRLHAERFSRIPFDVYKSRVRIVRDEAVVKQWIEEQSFRYEYTALNVPEPLKFPTREAVTQHFRQVHLPNIIRAVNSHIVRSPAARDALPPPLRRLARREFDLQQRFPLKLVTRLSDEFARRGLHFFKVNRTVLHVAVARPRYLDVEANPVTEGVKRIIATIESTPNCTRRKLLEAMGVSLPASEAGAEEPPPSPELQAIVTDLHWLVHEGHVIEFANGQLEVAKKPGPRPQPQRQPKAQEPKGQPAAEAKEQGQAPEGAGEAASGSEPTPTPEPLPEAPVAEAAPAATEAGDIAAATPVEAAPPGEVPESEIALAPEATPAQEQPGVVSPTGTPSQEGEVPSAASEAPPAAEPQTDEEKINPS